MAQLAPDPFGGARLRHVLDPGHSCTDMEAYAAAEALARAAVAPAEVDLLLAHTAVPDELMSSTACVLHDRLGLPAHCPAWQVDASAYSFLSQLQLARAMIAAGSARVALLVQSTAASRLLDRGEPSSALFGDGATAVVVGPVAGPGIVASENRTDGRWARTLVAAVRGGRWFDDGRAVLHVADAAAAKAVFLSTVDRGAEVAAAVLDRAGVAPRDVDFFGAHQGAPWLAELARDAMGLTRAKMVDVFPQTGYMFSASIPLGLYAGQESGDLVPGSLVLLFGGGTGMTYGATLMRWGRS
jgi:3-oxoacyl-[acyl-carrier-protein] synthase-3